MLSAVLAAALAASSPNTLCPVTGRPVVGRPYHYVTVNGRNYYVFDREAGIRLRNCPDCYLAKDGTPLNAPRPQVPGGVR